MIPNKEGNKTLEGERKPSGFYYTIPHFYEIMEYPYFPKG